jgi:hypothetical protein
MKGRRPLPLQIGCDDLAGTEIYNTIVTTGEAAQLETNPLNEILEEAARVHQTMLSSGFVNLGDYRTSGTDAWAHFPGSTIKMIYNQRSYSCTTGDGLVDTDTLQTFRCLNDWALSRLQTNSFCDVFSLCWIRRAYPNTFEKM